MNEKGTFYDLFAGIGGFRLGLERANFRCVGSCEIDKDARKVYSKNFGAEPEASNALKLDAGTMPDFDILAAGFPCQAFSTAGKRLGFNDARGTLFFEIARIAKQRRPRLLFLENVRGLLSHDEGRTVIRMLLILDELGYDVEGQVINGRHFLPQNRERIFIVGHLRDKPSKQVFPLGTGDQELVEAQGTQQGEGQRMGSEIASALDANYYKTGRGGRTMIVESGLWQSRGFQTRNDNVSHCLKGQGGSAGNFIQVQAVQTANTKANGRRIKPEGEPMFALDCTSAAAVLVKETEGRAARRVKEPGEPMFALPAQDKLGITDGQYIRRLTPTECERLQGFPDGWTEGVSDTARYRLLGNAVMPPVIEYIASHF